MWPSRDNINKPKEEAGHLVRETATPMLDSKGGALQDYPTETPKAAQALLQRVLRGRGQGNR